MITLFHYVHCPFCVRVRMAFGHLKTSYKSVVVPYNDEETPIKLTGVKMLPIAQFSHEEQAMNESLDIIRKADTDNRLQFQLLTTPLGKELEELLSRIGSPVHNLVMPYWIYTKEFNEQSRSYFQTKKEKKRGPFNELAKKALQYLEELATVIAPLETKLRPFYNSDTITILDIMLASHLWGMYVYPEYQFPAFLHEYLQKIKKECGFNYHEDFWSGELGD